MQLLLVSATYMEIAPLAARLKFTGETDQRTKAYSLGKLEIDMLITGVGMVATAHWCSRALAKKKYDAALNLGVCGSFDKRLIPGTVVHIVSDRLAELGAEDDEKFLSVHELNLLGENEFPFKWGQLFNQTWPSTHKIESLPQVQGITVNKTHGNEKSIAQAVQLFNPHVESMEGAAFFYSCMSEKIPCAQVRAVSNIVEKRNREAWNMALAIKNLDETAIEILKEFAE